MTKQLKTKIQSLDAIVLIANNFEKQSQFYKEVLGLEVIEENSDAVFFAIDAQKLAIFAKSHHPEGTQQLGGAAHGISHLKFGIDEPDAKQLTEQLKAAKSQVDGHHFEDARCRR